jgi:hypothetical protein
MKWITREHVHVDRVACPWLIKKYIDRSAEFFFTPPEKLSEVAKKEQAIPFDAEGVELGHQGNDCSFETIIKKYKIKDPILDKLQRLCTPLTFPPIRQSSRGTRIGSDLPRPDVSSQG